MDFTGKLDSFADRRAFQGIELHWRSGRCSGHHLDCPGSRRAVYLHFCTGSDCVVHLAGDRHAAQQQKHKQPEIKPGYRIIVGEQRTGAIHGETGTRRCPQTQNVAVHLEVLDEFEESLHYRGLWEARQVHDAACP